MKKSNIIICRGFVYPRKKRYTPWGQALYRQYRVENFDFEVEIFNRYAIILHIHPVNNWSIDLLRNASNKAMLKAKGRLEDFLLSVPSITGVCEKFTPAVEWGD